MPSNCCWAAGEPPTLGTLSRFSTSTILGSKCLVPWLAAEGPLAYSPAEPPARDYFFQYSWMLPGIFDSQINLREHRYFGSRLKERAGFLFDFWEDARKGRGAALPQYCQPGIFSDVEVKAPMAACLFVSCLRWWCRLLPGGRCLGTWHRLPATSRDTC